ncbi:MAG: hypothetical protein HPY53_08575 [Brevinematales bacterium]|nr:hypothetical protein [Brevinematales bacterium]
MESIPKIIQEFRNTVKNISITDQTNEYFELLQKIWSTPKIEKRLKLCEESFKYIEALIITTKLTFSIYDLSEKWSLLMDDNKKTEKAVIKKIQEIYPNLEANSDIKEFGKFDLSSIPALQVAGEIYALKGMKEKIDILKDIVYFFSDLFDWRDFIENQYNELKIAKTILEYIKNNPGFHQNKIKAALELNQDGRYIAGLIKRMESYNLIKRKKEGNNYNLFLE